MPKTGNQEWASRNRKGVIKARGGKRGLARCKSCMRGGEVQRWWWGVAKNKQSPAQPERQRVDTSGSHAGKGGFSSPSTTDKAR